MTKRVFNMGGGAHSDAAYTAFEKHYKCKSYLT